MKDNIRVGIIGSGYIADFHAKAVQAIKALNQGIHVLVEKPMAVHASEALSGGKPVGEALKKINDQWAEILKNNGYIKL